MRIVGGEFRGRNLATPKSNDIRPTVDRTRESLFNIIGHVYPEAIEGTRVIDLFAGTGAVGLLSYGQRLLWNDVFEAGAVLSLLNRPYDGDRETDLRLALDLTYRF